MSGALSVRAHLIVDAAYRQARLAAPGNPPGNHIAGARYLDRRTGPQADSDLVIDTAHHQAGTIAGEIDTVARSGNLGRPSAAIDIVRLIDAADRRPVAGSGASIMLHGQRRGSEKKAKNERRTERQNSSRFPEQSDLLRSPPRIPCLFNDMESRLRQPPVCGRGQASSNIAAMRSDVAGSNRDQPSGPSFSSGRKRALYAIRLDPSIQ